MHVICLDSIPKLNTDPDEVPGLCIAIGKVDDHVAELNEAERGLVDGLALIRQREFAAGRRLARVALQHFNETPVPVLRTGRRPVWPGGFHGSITHSRSLAACALTNIEGFEGIGIDLSLVTSVADKVANRILDEHERTWVLQQGSVEWNSALFSAKESVYKAVNPAVGEYLGFHDVSITVDQESLTFSAATTIERLSTDPIAHGHGHFHRIQGHWLTLFTIGDFNESA